jgi:hypothetical protein
MSEYIHQGNGKLREIKAASGRRPGLNWIWFGALFTRIVYAGQNAELALAVRCNLQYCVTTSLRSRFLHGITATRY